MMQEVQGIPIVARKARRQWVTKDIWPPLFQSSELLDGREEDTCLLPVTRRGTKERFLLG
jgi:hypothetical protein